MAICPKEKCEHYGKATKYPRKCYYEPQCWRGEFEVAWEIIKLLLRRRHEGNPGSNGNN